MKVTRLNSDSQKQYSDFVTAHPSGSFLQSWGWGEYQISLGKNIVRYGVFNSSENLIATVQFVVTKVPILPGEYLYSAYGPLISSEMDLQNSNNLIDQILGQVKIDFPKVWFVRFEPNTNLSFESLSKKFEVEKTIHIQPGSTLISDLNLSEDELQNLMHQKTRYNIKVARKHNVTIENDLVAKPELGFGIAEGVALLTKTSDRQKYKSYGTKYYNQILTFFALQKNGKDCAVKFYTAHAGKECIASAIFVDHGNTRTYLFGGSDNNFRNLMAPYALHWEAMQDAKNLGLTKYDWWGAETASGKTPGFVQFKQRWGGTKIQYSKPFDIVFAGVWYSIYKVLRAVNRFV